MILFNSTSMFIQHIFVNHSNIASPSCLYHQADNKKIALVSMLTTEHDKNFYSNSLAGKKLLSRNFITKLINKYWQETIFLSVSNSVSDIYINKLKSSGIAVYKSQYKKFLLDFSKALNAGRIETSLDSIEPISKFKIHSTHLKYVWRKGLNFSLPNSFRFTFFKQTKGIFPNKIQLIIMKNLKDNDLPIFTLINGFNQIVMAEPSEEILNTKNLIDNLYQWYRNHFLCKKDYTSIYEGLFFINPEDALEYQEYIKYKYPKSHEQNQLSIFPSRLDFYYKLIRSHIPKTQFRLIPDLTELGELIFKYRRYRHVYFHNQQQYGNNYFQGQPIYFIEPTLAFNRAVKKMMPVKYLYTLNNKNGSKKYEAIFMNYKTALLAWQQFREQAIDYNLPTYPKLLVYNLEDFIKTCENNNQIHERNMLFIPSKECYQFVKSNSNNKPSKINISQRFSTSLLYLQVISKRIIWSLTSRQPVSW